MCIQSALFQSDILKMTTYNLIMTTCDFRWRIVMFCVFQAFPV